MSMDPTESFAIMSHEINDNDVEPLTKAKENLEKYLIEK